MVKDSHHVVAAGSMKKAVLKAPQAVSSLKVEVACAPFRQQRLRLTW